MSRYIDADKLYIAAMDTEFYDAADEDVVLELINQQPTADVQEVKHGEWLLEREPCGKPYCYHCTICDSDFHHTGIKVAWDFCPNCGAKMDKN